MYDEDSSDEDAQDDIVSEKKTMSAIAPSLVSSSLSTMRRLAMKISQDPELLINRRDEKRRSQQDRNADEMDGLEETMSSISISGSPRYGPMLGQHRNLSPVERAAIWLAKEADKNRQAPTLIRRSERKGQFVDSLIGEQRKTNELSRTLLTKTLMKTAPLK